VCKYPLAYALVPLSEHLPQLAEQCGLRTPSIVITSLTDGGAPVVHAAYQGDRALSPASWAAQESKPPDTVTITVTNMTANDAGSPLLPGYAASEEELGRLMLTRSDNVATNTLIDLLGREYINAYTQRIGLQGTALRRKLSGSLPLIDDPECTGRNAHPASDCETLAAQEWNEKLSRGLRPGDRFAHKTGDTDEVTHDGGILETSQGLRYVVVVYTGLPSSTDHDQRLCAFMKALRPHL
jgi:beta-lactamase class A